MTLSVVNVGRFLRTLTTALRPEAEFLLAYTPDEGYTVGLDAPGVAYLSGPHRSPSGALIECVQWLRTEENAALAAVLVDPALPLPPTEATVSPETSRMLSLAARARPCVFRDAEGRARTGLLVYWPIPAAERSLADGDEPHRSGFKARARLSSGNVISFNPADLVSVDDEAAVAR